MQPSRSPCNTLIYCAQRRLSITSPYFVPDESLLTALTTAARRGVAVELFVGEVGDQFFVFHAQHSSYAALLEAGVRIWLYPAPSVLHAKHVSVDELRAVEDEYRAVSRELTPSEWSRRSWGHRLVDDLTRLTSAVQ